MSRTRKNLEFVKSSAGIASPKFKQSAVLDNSAAQSMSELGFKVSNRLKTRANITSNGIGHPNSDKRISGFAQMDWSRPFIVQFKLSYDQKVDHEVLVMASYESQAIRLAYRLLLEQISDDFSLTKAYALSSKDLKHKLSSLMLEDFSDNPILLYHEN